MHISFMLLRLKINYAKTSTPKVYGLYWGGGRKTGEKKHLKCAFVALDLVKNIQSLHGGHHV